MQDIQELIPELSEWNQGNGIDLRSWFYAVARSDVALAYLDVFWPRFIEIDGYIFQSGINRAMVKHWENLGKYNRLTIEKVLNNIDVIDLFTTNSGESGLRLERCREILRQLGQIYRCKLALDFPQRKFTVSLSGLEPTSEFQPICLTFYQCE